MKKFILHNGRLVDHNQPLFLSENRSFRYGDGLFESMRYRQGEILWLKDHLQRLQKGMEILGFEENPLLIKDQIYRQLSLVEMPASARIRLSLYRDGAGTYLPQTNQSGLLIEVEPLDSEDYSTNEKGLDIGIYSDIRLQGHPLDQIKTANKLKQVIARQYAHKQGWDDALLLHQDGQFAEATASNFFVLKEDQLITPPLSSGCLAGVMRQQLMRIGNALNYQVEVFPIHEIPTEQGCSLWLCNTIQGIRWVRSLENRIFVPGPIREFTEALNQR